jgi:hypothetical protein
VCFGKGSEFYLRKLRRDTIVLIPAEVQVKHISHARCAQASRTLEVTTKVEEMKDCCCRECTESKDQILRSI